MKFFDGSSIDPRSSCDKNGKGCQGARDFEIENHSTKPI